MHVKTWGTWVNALEKMVGYENTLGWVGSEGPDAKNVFSVRHFNNGIPLVPCGKFIVVTSSPIFCPFVTHSYVSTSKV